jgi:hypothetical protein
MKAEDKMPNSNGSADGKTPRSTVPDLLKNVIAVVFVILFLVFVVVLAFNINSEDKLWGRYLVIFNIVQAFAAAGGGVLLGTTIKTQEVNIAQVKENTANKRASDTYKDGVTLRHAIEDALNRSTSSPSKLFLPSRAVRPQRTGETMMFVDETEAKPPTHWVVSANETKEVDPELAGLARIAADLFS